jgi:hypothetical protein
MMKGRKKGWRRGERERPREGGIEESQGEREGKAGSPLSLSLGAEHELPPSTLTSSWMAERGSAGTGLCIPYSQCHGCLKKEKEKRKEKRKKKREKKK